jgi:transposase
MPKPADLNRCLASLDQESTIIAVIEMSQSSWLVAGVVPGIERHPLKKLAPDQDALLRLLHRWREEAGQAGRGIRRHPGDQFRLGSRSLRPVSRCPEPINRMPYQ